MPMEFLPPTKENVKARLDNCVKIFQYFKKIYFLLADSSWVLGELWLFSTDI